MRTCKKVNSHTPSVCTLSTPFEGDLSAERTMFYRAKVFTILFI